MKYYRLAYGEIQRRDVIRETEKFIYVLVDYFGKKTERREAKRTTWDSWHTTWDEAHTEMLSQAQRNVDAAQSHLSSAKQWLAKVQEMRRPADED